MNNGTEGEDKTIPQELHFTLKRNNGKVIGMYDEVSLLYEQLDKYKNGSSDRKTFLSLINGSEWRRNFRNCQSVVEEPWFNIAGFVQPEVVVRLLNGNDYDGFWDRQMFVCPPERDADYDEIIPMPADIPGLGDIFRIMEESHEKTKNYTLSTEGHTEFVSYHDGLNERKRKLPRYEKDRRSSLLKAKGQMLRLAAVIYALDQAIKVSKETAANPQWSFIIPADFVKTAIYVQDYCVEQKFALGKILSAEAEESNVTVNSGLSTDPSDLNRIRKFLELPSPITVSKITAKHIQKKKDNKYTSEEADALMEVVKLHELGDIVVEEYNAGSQKRKKNVFVNRKMEELTEENKAFLKKGRHGKV